MVSTISQSDQFGPDENGFAEGSLRAVENLWLRTTICACGQPIDIPSAADDGFRSGRRLIRNELRRPSKPAMIGTSRAT
jgi:hypothetical protein